MSHFDWSRLELLHSQVQSLRKIWIRHYTKDFGLSWEIFFLSNIVSEKFMFNTHCYDQTTSTFNRVLWQKYPLKSWKEVEIPLKNWDLSICSIERSICKNMHTSIIEDPCQNQCLNWQPHPRGNLWRGGNIVYKCVRIGHINWNCTVTINKSQQESSLVESSSSMIKNQWQTITFSKE